MLQGKNKVGFIGKFGGKIWVFINVQTFTNSFRKSCITIILCILCPGYVGRVTVCIIWLTGTTSKAHGWLKLHVHNANLCLYTQKSQAVQFQTEDSVIYFWIYTPPFALLFRQDASAKFNGPRLHNAEDMIQTWLIEHVLP